MYNMRSLDILAGLEIRNLCSKLIIINHPFIVKSFYLLLTLFFNNPMSTLKFLKHHCQFTYNTTIFHKIRNENGKDINE